MKKIVFSTVFIVLTTLLVSCSSDPFVGQWVPDNDRSGTNGFRIENNGTVVLYGDAPDGTYSMSGKWEHVEGTENAIIIKYDASTIKVNLDSSLAEYLMKMMLSETASVALPMTISDDGERLDGGGNGYFVKY